MLLKLVVWRVQLLWKKLLFFSCSSQNSFNPAVRFSSGPSGGKQWWSKQTEVVCVCVWSLNRAECCVFLRIKGSARVFYLCLKHVTTLCCSFSADWKVIEVLLQWDSSLVDNSSVALPAASYSHQHSCCSESENTHKYLTSVIYLCEEHLEFSSAATDWSITSV